MLRPELEGPKRPPPHVARIEERMLNAWHGLGNDGPDLTNGETPTCLPRLQRLITTTQTAQRLRPLLYLLVIEPVQCF